MANPLLQTMMGNNPTTQQLTQLYQGINNPQQLIQNNPQLQQILAMYNGDAKTAFYSMCKQRGIDPNMILNQLNNNYK